MNKHKISARMKPLLLILISTVAAALILSLISGLNLLPFGNNNNPAGNDQTHTAPPPADAPASVAGNPGFTVNQDTAEVRSGPSTEYPVIGVVNRGQTFTPNGRTPAGDWLQFPWEGMDGWIHAPSLTVIGSGQLPVVRRVPPPPPPPPPPPSDSSPPDSPPPDSPPSEPPPLGSPPSDPSTSPLPG